MNAATTFLIFSMTRSGHSNYSFGHQHHYNDPVSAEQQAKRDAEYQAKLQKEKQEREDREMKKANYATACKNLIATIPSLSFDVLQNAIAEDKHIPEVGYWCSGQELEYSMVAAIAQNPQLSRDEKNVVILQLIDRLKYFFNYTNDKVLTVIATLGILQDQLEAQYFKELYSPRCDSVAKLKKIWPILVAKDPKNIKIILQHLVKPLEKKDAGVYSNFTIDGKTWYFPRNAKTDAQEGKSVINALIISFYEGVLARAKSVDEVITTYNSLKNELPQSATRKLIKDICRLRYVTLLQAQEQVPVENPMPIFHMDESGSVLAAEEEKISNIDSATREQFLKTHRVTFFGAGNQSADKLCEKILKHEDIQSDLEIKKSKVQADAKKLVKFPEFKLNL